ncbi:hypothetical protein [Streptomyces liangshanensis]|uniref:Uncharacterized protein n=1 Tax=Streptomyces liangshanensis TaxID=2717324 RepID=A0A6G9H6J0_9ACTN|nr:hypothetical protein [Streptomyces liangshanensis]QIQ06162.1 hypothetical protein HA039_31050 [Streptomyces liangshanensis]
MPVDRRVVLNRAVSVDSAIVRAHQHAAGAAMARWRVPRRRGRRRTRPDVVLADYDRTATLYLAGILIWSDR